MGMGQRLNGGGSLNLFYALWGRVHSIARTILIESLNLTILNHTLMLMQVNKYKVNGSNYGICDLCIKIWYTSGMFIYMQSGKHSLLLHNLLVCKNEYYTDCKD